jgi:aspartate aminotransferase
MYTKAELQALGRVLSENPSAKSVWVLSDEIYDRIVFAPAVFCSFLDAAPQLRDRTVTVNGLSKSAAMTGWRVGWSVAPNEITQAMSTLQGQSTSGICSLTQAASIAALKLPEAFFADQVAIYRKKRDVTLEVLQKSRKLKVRTPEGAFYAFVDVGACLKSGEDALGFAERLLQEAGVAVVPGTPFGDPRSVRISFATDESSLKLGLERLVGFTG